MKDVKKEEATRTKVLIVEDDPTVLETCKAVLDFYGFEFLAASNGIEGLEIYRQRHNEIGLVLSDVSMPFMNGIQMIRDIFAIHSDSNIILMSGNLPELSPDDRAKLCSILPKPFTPKQLVEAVKSGLKHQGNDHSVAESPTKA